MLFVEIDKGGRGLGKKGMGGMHAFAFASTGRLEEEG